jgi:hypothetical protein
MQTICALRWQLAFVRCPQRILECKGEVEQKQKKPGGGIMMSKMLLRIGGIVSDAYTWIGVQTT